MKRSHKIALGIAASLGIGAATLSFAHPGMMMGGPMGMQLMTPEEQTALREKMHNAKTPEERQKLAQANRAEMEKRAKEKGITLPEPHGPGAGMGPQFGPHR